MGAPNSWVIRDVPKCTFVDVVTRKPLFYLQDLKTSGLDNTADTVYARGGSGNPKILGFSSNREGKIALENAVFDNAALAVMTGNPVTKGVKVIQQRDELAVATNAATLRFTPVSATGAILSVNKMNPDGSKGNELTYASGTVITGQYGHTTAKGLTFFAGDLANGEKIIAYYKTNTDATAQTITVSANKFSQSFGLIMDAIVKSPYDGLDYACQIEVFMAKAEDAWSIAMAADGDPSVHSMPIEMLKQAGQPDFYTITLYDGTLLT